MSPGPLQLARSIRRDCPPAARSRELILRKQIIKLKRLLANKTLEVDLHRPLGVRRGAARSTGMMNQPPVGVFRVRARVFAGSPDASGSSFRCGCKLITHLLHELPQAGNMPGHALLAPRFVALRGLFQVSKELLVREPLAA